MEPIKIVITKESVYRHIFATSAHMTRSREAMGIPASIGEHMLVTADKKEMLDPHITNSVNNVYCDIVRYHPGSSVGLVQDEFQFSINAPSNYPAGNGNRLKECIESYIANRTLQSWYTSIKPDEASIAAVLAQNDAASIGQLLVQRTKPTV